MLVSRRTREAGGWLLVLAGFGGAGIAWDRISESRISRFCWDPRHPAVAGAVQHFPQAVVGILAVRSARR